MTESSSIGVVGISLAITLIGIGITVTAFFNRYVTKREFERCLDAFTGRLEKIDGKLDAVILKVLERE